MVQWSEATGSVPPLRRTCRDNHSACRCKTRLIINTYLSHGSLEGDAVGAKAQVHSMLVAAYATYHDAPPRVLRAGKENVCERLCVHCDEDNCGRAESDSTRLYVSDRHAMVYQGLEVLLYSGPSSTDRFWTSGSP